MERTNPGNEGFTSNDNNSPDYGSFVKNKTIIEGQQSSSASESFFNHSKRTAPLVGFLVSYSNVEIGEFWELQEGRNTIGSSATCSIVLHEKTVSSHHATLVVRRSSNDNRLMFILSDENSSNGVRVNEQDIETEKHMCNNFDKIKIGGYELLIITIDKDSHNLKKNEKFLSSQNVDYSSKGHISSLGTRTGNH